jgi:hypothetical protein
MALVALRKIAPFVALFWSLVYALSGCQSLTPEQRKIIDNGGRDIIDQVFPVNNALL